MGKVGMDKRPSRQVSNSFIKLGNLESFSMMHDLQDKRRAHPLTFNSDRDDRANELTLRERVSKWLY